MIKSFDFPLCCWVLASTVALANQDVFADVPTVEAIEEDVLSSRRAISNGEVHLTTTVKRHNVSEERETRYVIYFDGDKARVDLMDTIPFFL